MKVKCKKYPRLFIADIGVRFMDGIAEVKAAKKIEALRRMQGFGFVFEGAPPHAPGEPEQPEQSGGGADET